MTATPAPRPHPPLGMLSRDAAARTVLDRITASLSSPAPRRRPPTFNSAV